jgi:hypothetical protein
MLKAELDCNTGFDFFNGRSSVISPTLFDDLAEYTVGPALKVDVNCR